MEWSTVLLVAAPIVAAFVALGVIWFLWPPRRGESSLEEMTALFRAHRPALEKQFLSVAGASGKPRGLRWKECQWNELIAWVREKATGRLHALVGVTISFEAIEGSDMEGIEAVGNLRNATAVFFFDGAWQTAGRVVFNLNPDEAVLHFKDGYERVDVNTSA